MRTVVPMPAKREPYRWNAITDRPHWVYRCFDSSARLVYVGCTADIDKRLQEHADKAWWAPQVKWVEIERHIDRAAGREAERLAVVQEHPRWNIEYKRGRLDELPLDSALDYSEAVRRQPTGQHSREYLAILKHFASQPVPAA